MPRYTARRVKKPDPRKLSPLDAARLATARERYGAEDDRSTEEWIGSNYLEIWEFDVDGAHSYTLWHYMVDSGTTFHVNSAEVFGDVIQFGFGGPGGEENEIAEELEKAFQARRKARPVEPSGEVLRVRRARGRLKGRGR